MTAFPTSSPISHTCYMPHPSHYSWFYHPTLLGEEYRSLSSSLCSFLHSLVTSSLLGPTILLNTLFSKALSLHYSLNVSEQVSQPYRTTGKIIVLCILLCIFLDSKLEDKTFYTVHWMIASIPWLQSALNFFLNIIVLSGYQFCQTTVNQSHISLCYNSCLSAVGTCTFDHTSQTWWHSQVGSAPPS